ncbi:MAG: cytochrome c biogenesis protein ResB [bacterium]|nr:cytochrome c biogenesis protein ResB [bacterium]
MILVCFFSKLRKNFRQSLFVITISALTAMLILGTILPQNQPLAHYQAFVPQLAPWLSFLQLHNIYNSWLFLSLLALLAGQLFWNAFRHFFTHRSASAPWLPTCSVSLLYAGAALAVTALLLSNSPWSFSGEIKLTEGACATIPEISAPELSIELQSLEINIDSQGRPLSYISRLLAHESNGLSAKLETSVNSPAHYRCLDFYQSGCGSAAVEIICQTGQSQKSYPLPLPDTQGTPLLEIPSWPRYRYIAHRFYPHATWQGGAMTSHSSVPGQGAALILELDLGEKPNAPGKSPKIIGCKRLGWITSKRRVKTSAGAYLLLGKQYNYSVIRYKRDTGYPCLLLGFFVMLCGLAGYYYSRCKEEITWNL